MIPDEHLSRIKGSGVIALPQSASRVLELTKNPENGPKEYAAVFSADPGLVAQILKFANSSFFGFRYKITTIQMAVSLISVRTIKNFVLWNAVFTQLSDPRVEPFRLQFAIQDALRRGVFCKIYAEFFPALEPEELFIAGLFQDIAISVLVQKWKTEYKQFLTELKEGSTKRLSQLEDAHFGWNHAEAGVYLLEEWGISESITRSVRNHFVCNYQAGGTTAQLSDAVVALSALLPSSCSPHWNEADRFFGFFFKINADTSLFGKLGTPTLDSVCTKTDAQYEDMLKITQIPSPSFSLCNCLQQYLIQKNFEKCGQ